MCNLLSKPFIAKFNNESNHLLAFNSEGNLHSTSATRHEEVIPTAISFPSRAAACSLVKIILGPLVADDEKHLLSCVNQGEDG